MTKRADPPQGRPKAGAPLGGGRRSRLRGDPDPLQAAGNERIRFDKWLWAARFYKTRSLAAQAIDTGQARVGDERVKPARAVRPGETVSVRKSGLVVVVEVVALSDRRGGAAVAATLYRETAGSVRAREELQQQRRAALDAAPRFPGRPTKRQRRKLEDFLNEP
jgi:ribosome-associated heat shock protein Hsp15